MQLLIGAGSSRVKKLALAGAEQWSGLVTLDGEASHGPDVLHDLTKLPLPFMPNTASEIHAYDVMEHVGQQGDWRFWFAQWSDFWRILKPGGVFFGISPDVSSPWAWGDPGHTRIMTGEAMTFLHQPSYDKQVGVTAMTDYRSIYRADYDPMRLSITDDKQFVYILQAVKPSRCTYGQGLVPGDPNLYGANPRGDDPVRDGGNA